MKGVEVEKQHIRNPNEIFVGDLSFFCQESHLIQLFGTFGKVDEARIKRSDRGGRTLMYGFVRMVEHSAAAAAATALNGKLHMGRVMRYIFTVYSNISLFPSLMTTTTLQ